MYHVASSQCGASFKPTRRSLKAETAACVDAPNIPDSTSLLSTSTGDPAKAILHRLPYHAHEAVTERHRAQQGILASRREELSAPVGVERRVQCTHERWLRGGLHPPPHKLCVCFSLLAPHLRLLQQRPAFPHCAQHLCSGLSTGRGTRTILWRILWPHNREKLHHPSSGLNRRPLCDRKVDALKNPKT